MNAPSLDQIIQAVLDWQHRQPLAERLPPHAVHSIGLVALPYLRAGGGDEAPPPGPPWKRWLKRLRRGGSEGGGHAAFTERFIDGLSPQRAAAFGLRHGVEAVEGADEWPQRRIGVDDDAAVAGGWPFERWLLSAALDGRHSRQRVLISLEPPLQVIGRRVLDRRRLIALGVLLALPILGAVGWLSRAEPEPAPPELRVSGAVQRPSAPASSVASAPVVLASAVQPGASVVPPATDSASAASAPPLMASTASAPLIDIRPRLGPSRRNTPPAVSASAPVEGPRSAAATPSPGDAAPATAPTPAPAAAASAPLGGTSDPERVGPRLPSQGPVVALVSPVFAQREEADAMLTRMRNHLAQTGGGALEGGIFEAQGGYRAAVWPFASREEAQLLNATMIARGWRTRAVDF